MNLYVEHVEKISTFDFFIIGFIFDFQTVCKIANLFADFIFQVSGLLIKCIANFSSYQPILYQI